MRTSVNSRCSKNNLTRLFYYDKITNTCEIYKSCASVSSGSSVNGRPLKQNRFITRKKCENTCIHEGRSYSFNMKVCLLAPVEGPCRHYSTRFFYDPEEGKCLTFTYGGCFGNKNNFHSSRACDRSCHGAENKTQLSLSERNTTAVCYLSDVSGPCRGSIRRFHYDPDAKTCLPFLYGGCGGNENRFVREEDCVKRCMPWATTAMIKAAAQRDDEAGDTNEDGSHTTSPLIIAEVVLGTILVILLFVALGLSYRYGHVILRYQIYFILPT